jgi:hypothetical protein
MIMQEMYTITSYRKPKPEQKNKPLFICENQGKKVPLIKGGFRGMFPGIPLKHRSKFPRPLGVQKMSLVVNNAGKVVL